LLNPKVSSTLKSPPQSYIRGRFESGSRVLWSEIDTGTWGWELGRDGEQLVKRSRRKLVAPVKFAGHKHKYKFRVQGTEIPFAEDCWP
jgi:hypothetical protein